MKLLNHTLSYLSIALLLVIGVWAIVFYVNMLDEIYDSIDDGLGNSKILIIDKVKTDSTLIFKTDFMESNYAIHEISAQRAATFRDVYMDSTFYMRNESDFEPVRILKTAFRAENGKYYMLQIVSSMVEEDDLIADLLSASIWLYILLIASILIINNVLLRRIWKPFYYILGRLKSFQPESDHAMATVKTDVTEFNELNETVSDLFRRTIDTFKSQKQFIENASHELQTPLAISINKLELMVEKNSFSDEQFQELSSVIQTLERLTRLNKTLLLLSKIDNRQFTDEILINFGDLAQRTVNAFSDFAEFKSVNISLLQQGELIYKMNPELAEIMLTNLLKNAIVHNRHGGTVAVRITNHRIFIENTSEAPKLDEAQIFKRFYKSSSNKASTGLGLAIVRSIASRYNFELFYEYDGKHEFSIIVPADR